jgi:hypothetical protein
METISTVPAKRSTAALVVAWLIVTVPAAWGVSQTIHKSLALFTSARPTSDSPAPVVPTPGQSSSH